MSEENAWQLAQEAAAAYEKDYVPAIFAHWPPVLLEIARIRPGDRLLDVGCGTGVLAREAAARVVPAGRVTGLDLNEAMLVVARRLGPSIDWRQGDATSFPFDDGTFDVVASQLALMFFPDRAAALREMWRVLAPGGRMVVAVCGPASKGYATLVGLLRREAGEAAAAMVESYFALGAPHELPRLCGAAGIPGASVETRQGFARFASIDELVRIEIRGSPLSGLVDESSYRKVQMAAREELQEFTEREGRVHIRLDTTIAHATKG